jgi:hypothetical protein
LAIRDSRSEPAGNGATHVADVNLDPVTNCGVPTRYRVLSVLRFTAVAIDNINISVQ